MGTSSNIETAQVTTQESLFRAAQALDEAARGPNGSPGLLQDVHQALRECVLAVEYHLDTVCGKQGVGAAREDAPRLLPELEKLEADLARCLVEVWEAKSASVHPTAELLSALKTLAGHVRAAASEEFELVHEVLRPIGAID